MQTGCGTTKNVKKTKPLTNLSTKKIIQKHYAAAFEFETLKARIKAKYRGENKGASPTVDLRMEKDQKIWMSVKVLGIVMAKALITPTRVQYYENLKSTYFDGDFSLLSKWLGTELDFEKVQNLLLGQAVYDLKKERFTHTMNGNIVVLTPEKELPLFERLFEMQPSNFKMQTQRLSQPTKSQELLITYPEYQTVADQNIPESISIKATKSDKISTILLDYKSVDYNVEINFPFKIPSGAKEITIK